jgi:uncharacterized integral membrane protein
MPRYNADFPVDSTVHQSSERTKKVKSMEHALTAWLFALLTLILLAMTTLYATQATSVSKIRMVSSSRSHAIFVLRALSEVTGVLLAATIAATFERVQWLCVMQENGVRLADYLALQAGTGMMGLLALAVGRGVPNVTTRVFSAIRLVSILLVPVLGVLIMSKPLLPRTKIYTLVSLEWSSGTLHAEQMSSYSPPDGSISLAQFRQRG